MGLQDTDISECVSKEFLRKVHNSIYMTLWTVYSSVNVIVLQPDFIYFIDHLLTDYTVEINECSEI